MGFGMSRLGRKPIQIPAGVTATINPRRVEVVGPKGTLTVAVSEAVSVTVDGELLAVSASPKDSAVHGLARALLANAVTGVVSGFEKKLELQGVGYQASCSGKTVTLNVGFALPVKLTVPESITCTVPDNTHIVIRGCDRQEVGQFAASVRAVRPPEPFKGKGIRYQGEKVRRKAGKAFGAK